MDTSAYLPEIRRASYIVARSIGHADLVAVWSVGQSLLTDDFYKAENFTSGPIIVTI